MAEITCALASEAEAAACLALLPERQGVAPVLMIARRAGAFAGAAAVHWRSWLEPPGFPLWLRVAPPFRGQGVGRALVEGAAALARDEVGGLWSMRALPPESPAAGFLTACGFTIRQRTWRFAAGGEALLERCARVLRRGHPRAAEADPWRFEALSEAHLDGAAWLIGAGLSGGPIAARAALRRRLPGGPDADGDRSQVALHGDRVGAVILWRIVGAHAEVEAVVIDEAWRGGRLHPLMLHAQIRRGLDEGLSEMRFSCDERARDTMNIARLAGAVAIGEDVGFYRPL